MGKRGEAWFLLQLVLFALILFSPRIEAYTFPVWLRLAGLLVLAGGGVLGTAGGLALGRNLSPFPKPVEDGYLVTTGIYRAVRHPIYAGLVLGTLGWGLLMNSLLGVILALVLFLFFDVKSRREERWLLQTYPDYAQYRRRVRKLIPWIY